MPTLTTTIEDFSPVILYSGSDWTAGTSNDSSIDEYSDSSYMVTQVANATFSFTFYGTGVQLYGAERADHGLYQVTINTRLYDPVNGQANGTQHFQTSLFGTVALANGFHTVKVQNLGTTKLDLDFITWETPIGQDDESLLSFTIQDSDSSFVYTPASAWSTNPPNIGSYNGGSAHVTSTAGAYVDFTFEVSAAVAIYGPVGNQSAPYSVQLDNGTVTNYTSAKQFNQPQTMLFQAGGLSSGAHTIRLTSQASPAVTLGIDYALVFSAPSLQPKHTLATGSILAIVFGILLAFSLIATGYLFFSHRRRTPVKEADAVVPFSQVAYQSLAPQSPGLLQPTSHTSMQSSHFGDTSDISDPNTQVIFVPQNFDRKYRPDLSPSSQDTPNSPPSNSTTNPDMTEQGGSRLEVHKGANPVILRPPGVAPPSYVRAQAT